MELARQNRFRVLITLVFVITFGVELTLCGLLPRLLKVNAASAPNIVTYQGRVLNTNGVPVSDSSLNMEFRFYTAITGGTCLWSNSSSDCDGNTPASTVARSVTLTDGLFTQDLGDTGATPAFASIPDTVFADNASIYLEVEIAGEVLSPRKQVTAAPYALNADTLDGYDSSDFLVSLNGAYDNYGATASIINIDAAEGQTGGLEFSIDGTDNLTFDMQSTGDFVIQDAGSPFFTINNTQTIDYTTDATTDNAIDITANSITSGDIISISSSNNLTGDFISVNSTGNASGALLKLTSAYNAAPVSGITIDFDNGDTDENVILVYSDEVSESGSPADSVKLAISASGEVFTAYGMYVDHGADETWYRGNLITANGAFTWNMDTSVLWQDDGINAMMTLTDAGSVGNLDISGDVTITGDNLDSAGAPLVINATAADEVRIGSGTPSVATGAGDLYVTDGLEVAGTATVNDLACTDCLDFAEFADAMTLDSSTIITQDGTNIIRLQADISGASRTSNMMELLVASDVTNSFSGDMLRFTLSDADSTGDAISITNAGTGNGVYVAPSDTSGTSPGVTSTAGINVLNTNNNNMGLTVYSDNDSNAAAPLAYIFADNSAFDVSAMRVASDGVGDVLALHSTNSSSTADTLDITAEQTGGNAIKVVSSATSGMIMHLTANSMTTGDIMNVTANALTAGSFLDFTTSAAFSGASISLTATGAHTGNGLDISSGNGSASGSMINLANAGTGNALVIAQTGDAQSIDIDSTASSATAIDVSAATANYIATFFNDGNADTNMGISIQACLDANPTTSCDFIKFLDGDGGVLGAIEGDGAGGVTAASGGSDYAELFPGVYSNFSAGDILALDASGQVKLASEPKEVIGTMSVAPNTLGNWVDNWQASNAYVPVALLGQVPVTVNLSAGSIAVGDYITLSDVPGQAMKMTGPGYAIGIALASHTSGIGQIEVLVNPGWHANAQIAADASGNGLFQNDFAFATSAAASAGEIGVASNALSFRGSAWTGASAATRQMLLMTDVADSENYRLAIQNNDSTEVAYINNSGDLALAGNLYPSDRGALQTDKYIFYDSSGAPALDYMRTNAAGWGTGSYDFAEMFPSTDTLIAGEVVVFGSNQESIERSSGEVYDRKIAGVVSSRPGFLAGELLEGHYPVALAGRVPTYVSGQNGSIAPGDPLTTSSKPGYAMRATEPGPIIGYAMEAFSGETGSIIAFIRPAYYDGGANNEAPATANLASGQSSFNSLSVSGTLSLEGGSIISVSAIAGIGGNWELQENGDLVTRGRFTHVIESYSGEDVEVYGTLSPQTTIQLSGTAELKDGVAMVDFEKLDSTFNDVISTTQTYRVFLTAFAPTGQLYALNRTPSGFVIRESGSASSTQVDWLVIAYHKDFEPEPTEDQPTASEPTLDDPITDAEEQADESELEGTDEEQIEEDSEPEVQDDETQTSTPAPDPVVDEPPAESEPEPEPEPDSESNNNDSSSTASEPTTMDDQASDQVE